MLPGPHAIDNADDADDDVDGLHGNRPSCRYRCMTRTRAILYGIWQWVPCSQWEWHPSCTRREKFAVVIGTIVFSGMFILVMYDVFKELLNTPWNWPDPSTQEGRGRLYERVRKLHPHPSELSWSLGEDDGAAGYDGRNIPNPYIGYTNPYIGLLPAASPYVPNHAVTILFSWSREYCTYAFVTWRSVRRLDVHMRKDILLMVEQDDDWADAVVQANALGQRTDNLAHQQQEGIQIMLQAFKASVASKWSECKAVMDIIVHESNLQLQTLESMQYLRDVKEIPFQNVGMTYLAFVTPVKIPSDVKLKFAQWTYSLHKIHLFGYERYKRILLLDADLVLIKNLDSYFGRKEDLVAVRDQWQHCSRPDKMNGGTLSFRPSQTLLLSAKWILENREGDACMKDQLIQEADQSVINCMCGVGGPGYSDVKKVHDVTCGFFPSRMALFSGEGDSPDKPVFCPPQVEAEVQAVHFTWKPKPLDWTLTECMPARTSASTLAVTPHSTPARCTTGIEAMFTYWHCLFGRGNFDVQDLRRGCEYRNAAQRN